jgi:hypothetical protein
MPTSDLQSFNQRIESAIRRIPDRLSSLPEGESIRADYARIFGLCIGGMERPTGMYSLLPMHLSLLTDPHLFITRGGFVVLDHPESPSEFAWAFELSSQWRNIHVHDTATCWSLYENRFPRVIVCPHKGESAHLSVMLNRLTNQGFHGPFLRRPTLVPSGLSTGPFQSLQVRARQGPAARLRAQSEPVARA